MNKFEKKAYFQGASGKEAEKKKKKDKPYDPTDTMARGVLFKNYDLYEVEPTDLGPGTGFYQNMDKYKSVDDFRKAKKKRKERLIEKRKAFFKCIELTASKKTEDDNDLVDPTELTTTSIPFSPAEVSPIGMYDGIYPKEDLEGKPVTNLYYGRVETHYADDKKK